MKVSFLLQIAFFTPILVLFTKLFCTFAPLNKLNK